VNQILLGSQHYFLSGAGSPHWGLPAFVFYGGTMNGFAAKHFSHTQILTLDGPIDQVFPLFGPLEERRWAQGWNPTVLYSDSVLGDSPGTVFISNLPGEPETVWYVAQFDSTQHLVEYVRVTPGHKIALVRVRCDTLPDDHTSAAVTYAFTALRHAGNNELAHLERDHPSSVQHWQDAINHYLRTGEAAHH
jgi:hypothetical protein